jgi:hypothetical protein
MAVINDVIVWAETLPDWQKDLVRRLLENGDQELGEAEYSEILAMATSELNLGTELATAAPVPPVAGILSGSPENVVDIKLLSIDDLQNVNIIKPGQSQPLAENGISVIYGGNGSGKSGYSRVLKLACRSRDKDEKILPNVFDSGSHGTAKATLHIKENEEERDIIWTQGTPADPILTNVTVFDGRCARVITDSRNEISYLPYGADIFRRTAEIVLKIKTDIEAGIKEAARIQDSAVQAGTLSAKFIESLTEDTSDEDIGAATQWADQDEKNLVEKEELARASDSTKANQEIERLNKVFERIEGISKDVQNLAVDCGKLSDDRIKNVISELHAAKLANETATAERSTPEPLPGVATSDQWEILYKAAKQYSEEIAYPDEKFPKTEGARCVLCQQPLREEAVDRFTRFNKFMEDSTYEVLTATRRSLEMLHEEIELVAPLTGSPLKSICDEVSIYNKITAESLRVFHMEIERKKKNLQSLLIEGKDPEKTDSLPPWPETVKGQLVSVCASIAATLEKIEKTAMPEEHVKLLAEIAELKSRKALRSRTDDISAYVARRKQNAQLSTASSALRTQEITRKGTDIIRENLTPELQAGFEEELKALGAVRFPISFQPRGDFGETAHEMQIEGATMPSRTRTSEVLSEGETRVIAIAGFLAELRVASHSNGIVLDDPVSSLDHIYAQKIAERLVHEGLTRQVIIFTHNIAFLMELQDASDALAREGSPIELAVHTLRSIGSFAGITTSDVPWYTMKVSQRVHYLDELVHKIRHLYDEDRSEYNDEAARVYGLLREAWESCIEDDLLDSVVCRYRNSVQTLKLEEVEIQDEDIHRIYKNMSKVSAWMTGHDRSKALDHNRPSPDELSSDIASLREFSAEIRKRRNHTKQRRQKQLTGVTEVSR